MLSFACVPPFAELNFPSRNQLCTHCTPLSVANLIFLKIFARPDENT